MTKMKGCMSKGKEALCLLPNVNGSRIERRIPQVPQV